jgi:hypothetical protein
LVFAPVDDEPDAPPEDAPPDEDELLGDEELDDPLGDEELEEPLGDEEPDAPADELPEVELLGDADGLLEDELLLACTPSFDAVSLSIRPVAFRPSFCWKSRRAAWVLGPILPSTSPGS